MALCDDDSDLGVQFENGHWQWSEVDGGLEFVSDAPPAEEKLGQKTHAHTGNVNFRDNLEIMEQERFRMKYQRKVRPGDPEVVTLQDLKDVVIYTAPADLITAMLIEMLHVPTTERFIRSLILYCQYYLQVREIMEVRQKQMVTMVRSEQSASTEQVYRDNLSDLRALCAKEYCTMRTGGNDTRRFHHMGLRRRRSLSGRGAQFCEALVRCAAQLVWLALGRQHYHQIALEINRLLKSDFYNSMEHNLRSGYPKNLSREERSVLLGPCLRHHKKLTAFSPLHNEIFCLRNVDYRLLGLGVIKYESLPRRLRYLEWALIGPEEKLVKEGVVLGIVGLPRNNFDAMLNPTTMSEPEESVHSSSIKAKSISKVILSRMKSKMGSKSSKSSMSEKDALRKRLFPNIELPPREEDDALLPAFPDTPCRPHRVNHSQRRLWLEWLKRKRQRTRSAPTCHKPRGC